jgi:[glutamine synthetase] adenylyltransferase / [glutamine synthetase]-adenylyl-L-tyrosine phosphorylase
VRDGLSLDEAPDPELARVAWERVRDAGATVEDLRLIRLLGFSPAAADFLVRHPDEAAGLAAVSPRDRASLDSEVAGDVERSGAMAGLRRFRRRAMLRVATRDLAGAVVDDVVREISDIADACVGVACPTGLAVVALGKWGGRELNYASDVDLLLVHADAAEGAGELVRLLSEQTEDGIALKVDAAVGAGGSRDALSQVA